MDLNYNTFFLFLKEMEGFCFITLFFIIFCFMI